jgi:hypothetical protein
MVHDSKEPDGLKVSSFNTNSLQTEQVEVDWSRTGAPRDLEAVANLEGRKGEFLAVEGSRYGGVKPHMFLFEYGDGQGQALQRYDLPELPYEVEGMVTQRKPDGDLLVVLGGRGDKNSGGEGHLHWGTYHPEDQSLTWSKEGVEGVPVQMPENLGPNQRAISDLNLTPNGELWAAGCVDNGNEGPFESLIYRVGHLDSSRSNPITLTLDHAFSIPGQKVEALDSSGGRADSFLAGTDNENFGGALQSLLRPK